MSKKAVPKPRSSTAPFDAGIADCFSLFSPPPRFELTTENGSLSYFSRRDGSNAVVGECEELLEEGERSSRMAQYNMVKILFKIPKFVRRCVVATCCDDTLALGRRKEEKITVHAIRHLIAKKGRVPDA